MFSSSQQGGFISIFYSVGSSPLAIWDKQVKNGHIRRLIDEEVKSLVLDIGGTNVATTYITCPIKPCASLGIKLPYLVMVIKNMKKYFTFEIQILDDKDMRRRFRVSNFQSTTKVRPFCTTMPIGLSSGWNQVQFNLADFAKRAYGSVYLETVRVQIHANVRIRRIYFTDQLHSDDELPNEFKLLAPKSRKEKKSLKEFPAAEEAPVVPPIKTQLKPSEEVPPPPTPAEESPVAVKEKEPSVAALQMDEESALPVVQPETEETPIIEEEIQIIETDAQPEILPDEITEITDQEPSPEVEQPEIAVISEQETQGELETNQERVSIPSEVSPADQEEVPVVDGPLSEITTEEPTVGDDASIPVVEETTEITTEATDATEATEATETTEATEETDLSPSEPATTDQGEED
ncbi:hypothetical protein ABEB36_012259 [Hypothenemus hampei]|uniref:CFA20 domain-containing protein n=1 Tax=Hypothenemus hampei TaxID=57062 RepID=A0ABD1EBD6_HYPHA